MLTSRRSKQYVLALGDLIALFLALFLSLILRYGELPSLDDWWLHVTHFAPTYVGWLLVFYTAGLYSPEFAFGIESSAIRLLGCSIFAVLATAVMFYLGGGASITPKTVLALFGILAFSGVYAWRATASAIGRKALARTAIGFVGWSPAAEELYGALVDEPTRGFDVAGIYPGGSSATLPQGRATRTISELAAAVEARGDGILVLGEDSGMTKEDRVELFGLLGKTLRFMRLDDFYELVFRRVPIGIIDDLWFLENIDLRANRSYEPFKRILDLLVATLGLLLSSPLWLVATLLVKASSPGPVFFKQIRLGLRGKPFTIIKFRTMRIDRNDFAPTEKGDPRVTAIGKFLRASRLDEIPQLLNVFIGDMSFIGPRPERPELAEGLAAAVPFYYQRLLVKPGLSGWDQVSGEYHSPSVEDTYKKLQYDLYYVKNRSPLLDISIFFKTIMTVLLRAGR